MQEKSIKVGIVVSEFNYDVTQLMLQKAISHARFLNAEVKVVLKVPGTYDMPLAVKKMLEKDFIDAVIALGAVIKGETKHDEIVASQTARKLTDLSTEFGKPVTLGIIGPGATHEQAVERIEEYATRAVEAVIKLVQRIRQMNALKEPSEMVIIE